MKRLASGFVLALLATLLALPIGAQNRAPAPRVTVRATATGHQVLLSWNAPTGLTVAPTYNVYRCTGAASACPSPSGFPTTLGSFTDIGPGVTLPTTSSPYADSSVAASTTYTYQVTTVCPATGAGCGTTAAPINGESGPSGQAIAQIPANSVTPGAPTGLTIISEQ